MGRIRELICLHGLSSRTCRDVASLLWFLRRTWNNSNSASQNHSMYPDTTDYSDPQCPLSGNEIMNTEPSACPLIYPTKPWVSKRQGHRSGFPLQVRPNPMVSIPRHEGLSFQPSCRHLNNTIWEASITRHAGHPPASRSPSLA